MIVRGGSINGNNWKIVKTSLLNDNKTSKK